jgi:dTDP-4-amino-4,6-dideoxygalactose transaminase
MMRLHGLTRNAAERYGGPYSHYDMSVFGWKYNMSNIQAALLVGQLPRVKAMHQRRREIAGAYRSGLSGVPGVSLPAVPAGAVSAWHLFTIWVDPSRRDEVINNMQARGVGVAVNYRPVHLMSYYRKLLSLSEGSFPNAETVGASTISLPLYPKLTALEVEYVISCVREAAAS